jgi:hypothetical protein
MASAGTRTSRSCCYASAAPFEGRAGAIHSRCDPHLTKALAENEPPRLFRLREKEGSKTGYLPEWIDLPSSLQWSHRPEGRGLARRPGSLLDRVDPAPHGTGTARRHSECLAT